VKAAAAGAAARFAELVEARGGSLTRVELERLLDIAAGDGVPAPGRFAQAGHVARVAHPGGILGAADTVVWWSFAADDAPSAPRSPWSRAEREFLAKAGVVLEDPAARARREAEALLAPIRFAAKSLVLVVPDRRAGVEAAPHPVLDRVRAAFGEAATKLEISAADVLAGRASLLGAQVAGAPVALQPLPRLRRWWKLPPGSVPARATESYSSLDSFVQSPFRWLLNYPARLRPGELGGLPEGAQLLGTLAEELILEAAADAAFVATASEKDVTRRVEARLPGLLAESGAILLQPGFELERERLRACAVRAAWTLVRAMRDGQWRFDPALKELKGTFCGGEVMGVADMVLTRAKSPLAVLDLKWGWRSGRFKQLKENRALQLAVYSHCLREKNSPWPHIGYLIIQSAEILAPSAGAFPGATEVACAGDCADLWKAFEIRWNWRRKQLDAGRVEVVTEDTVPDADSFPPPGALEMDDETPFNDHVHLLGWEEGA
jgi:predicted NUDIX family NTP pyrophosphohydrolase